MAIPTSMTSGGVILQRAGYRVAALSADPTFWIEIQCSSSTAFASSRSQIQKLAPSAANQVLATFEMPFSTRTYFSRARSFKAGYSTGAWSTVASAKPYYLVGQMPDPGYYAHHVSRFGLLTSARSKTIRFPASNVLADSSTRTWIFDNMAIEPKTANVQFTGWGTILLPKGVKIVGFRSRWLRGTTTDLVSIQLEELSTDDTSIAVLASLTPTTHAVAFKTSTASVSNIVVGPRTYMVNIALKGVAVASNARFQWAEVDYTMPSMDKSL